MTYHEPKGAGGVAKKHQISALEAERRKNPISNAEILPDSKRYDKFWEDVGLDRADAILIEREVGSEISKIEKRDWGNYHIANECSFDNGEEWIVFNIEKEAMETAIFLVEDDVEEHPEWFENADLFSGVDNQEMERVFTDYFTEHYTDYVNDIESEDDDKFINRLAKEMYDSGIITHEEAIDESFNLEDKKEATVKKFVEEAIADGNYGYDNFEMNFGSEFAFNFLKENDLISAHEVAQDLVNNNGAGNTLSGYDGIQVDLSNGMVLYRVN